MKVKELIKELQELPEDYEVMVNEHYGLPAPADRVEVVMLARPTSIESIELNRFVKKKYWKPNAVFIDS